MLFVLMKQRCPVFTPYMFAQRAALLFYYEHVPARTCIDLPCLDLPISATNSK